MIKVSTREEKRMKILIAGGSGLLGKQLSDALTTGKHSVSWLSRSPKKDAKYPAFKWDPKQQFIDDNAFAGVDVIINLAGVPIIDKKWTEQRKSEIIASRAGTNRLLHLYAKRHPQIKMFISASAIGYYGHRPGELLTEDSEAGDPGDFLVSSTTEWERSHFEGTGQKIYQLTAIRIGAVLSKEGGAYPEFRKPIPFFIAPYFGHGRQYLSWIHIDDLIQIFTFCIEQNIDGIINGVAPEAISVKQFIKKMKSSIQALAVVIPAPAFILKLILGERARILLNDSRIASSRLGELGFNFHFPTAESAIRDLES